MNSRNKILLLLLSLSVLAGCGGKTASNTLVMWMVGSEEEAQIVAGLAKEKFTPMTGIEVRCESIAWAESHSKYLTAMAGDVTPDIGTMGLTWGTEFGSKGQMLDLKKEFPDGLEAVKKLTFPSIWNATEYKGSVYAVPFDMTLQIIYYRSDMIPNPPATWNELIALLDKLNRDKKSMIIDWGSLDWIGFSPFLWQAGGDYYDSTRTKSVLNSAEAVKALRFFAALYRKYGVPESGQGIGQGLRSGQYPIGLSGNWLINSLPADAPEMQGKWSIAMLPAGPSGKRTGFIGGRVMGIFSNSKKKNEAWQFIQFLCQEEIQAKIYEGVAKSRNIYMPPNIKAWKSLPMDAKFKEILMQQAKEAKAPPPVLGWDDSTRFIVEAIQRTVMQNADPSETLAAAAKVMDKNLKK